MRAIDRFLLLGQMLDDPIGLELLRQLQRFDVALQTGPIRFPRLFLDLERRHLRRRRLQLNLIQWNIGKTKKNKKFAISIPATSPTQDQTAQPRFAAAFWLALQ